MAATVTWRFPVIAKASDAAAFGFFAAMMVLQLLFVWKIMPETKGGALEDIEKRLAGQAVETMLPFAPRNTAAFAERKATITRIGPHTATTLTVRRRNRVTFLRILHYLGVGERLVM